MGFALVCTPTRSTNMHESDPGPSLGSKLLYEETKLNVGAYSNTDAKRHLVKRADCVLV